MCLAASFILEEGFKIGDLVRIVQGMAAGGGGDRCKVVERDKGDGVFIATTGVGVVAPGRERAGRATRSWSRGRSATTA